MSLIGEDGDKQVRMAHLATVASHHVNGLAALRSRLLCETALRDFAKLCGLTLRSRLSVPGLPRPGPTSPRTWRPRAER